MENSNSVSNLQILDAVNNASTSCAATQCDDTTTILQGQNGTNLANMGQQQELGLFIDDSIYRSQLANREAFERNTDHIKDTINYNSSHIMDAVERTGSAAVSATENTTNEITNLIQSTSGDIKERQESIALETRSGIVEHHNKALELNKDAVINDNHNASTIELQASANTFSVKKDLTHVDAALELQAAQNTAQIQYEAVKIQGQTSAEMADCCCELKEEVAKSNYETQKLARDIESKRLRDELAAATTESLINKLKYCKPKYKCRSPPKCPCPPHSPPHSPPKK
jgi:hypothetical protein